MRSRTLATALLLPLALTSACATKKKRSGVAPVDSATLEVRSNYIGSVDVFAIRENGFRVRLASNVGNRVQRVRLGPSLIGGLGSLRIIAVPLAERNVASTGAIIVRPGDVVEFTISPNLSASAVYIR